MFEVTEACAKVSITSRDWGEVVTIPVRKKVALVGFASNSLHLVPWDDPAFELWGMNQGAMNFKRRADRWFEMHSPEFTADVRDPQYIPWLQKLDIPVYMIEPREEFPTSLRYPIEEAIKFGGRDYFTSTIAFMLALAGMEEFEEVHLYGINLAIGDEYFYEKPCAEWWIGYLQGKGVKVVVPHASSLLKQYLRYGYYVDARPQASLKVLLKSRQEAYRQQCEKYTAEVNFWNGKAQAYRAISELLPGHDDALKPLLDEAESRRQEHTNNFHITRGQGVEAESLVQVAEGMEHGADLVLLPQSPTPSS